MVNIVLNCLVWGGGSLAYMVRSLADHVTPSLFYNLHQSCTIHSFINTTHVFPPPLLAVKTMEVYTAENFGAVWKREPIQHLRLAITLQYRFTFLLLHLSIRI